MKNKFSLNPDNQLLIKSSRAKTPILCNGSFSVTNNQLVYYINESDSWRREYSLPERIAFTGTWKLDSNYDLELLLEESETQHAGDRLIINGKIISAENNCLVFEAISKKISRGQQSEPGQYSFQLLKLSGIWRADEYNQLSFAVKKDVNPDIMTFQGAWWINQNQKITYTCVKKDLRTKARVTSTIEFEGFWEIGDSQKLRYILSESTGSSFNFRIQLESKNLYPTAGVIKYRIGIGASTRNRPREKTISLFGTWKFSRSLGLLFEMDYGEGRFRALEFGASVVLSPNNKFSFNLKDQRNQPFGLILTFTHKFLKMHDAEAFIRLETLLGKEGRAEVGVHIPF
ncbi:MAG: hypothetical protein ABSB18_01100 [Candidatus Omnitrophota bacterium]